MRSKLILVVDDNPDHLELTVMTLQDCAPQAQIATARDGAAALDYLCGGSQQATDPTRPLPALVLLDLKLGKVSGLDVLRKIRAHAPSALVPVVMLTSSGECSDVSACYQAGANAFVRKPVNFADFTQKLQCVQAFWLGVNESPVPS
jgi:two-component system, response regulator